MVEKIVGDADKRPVFKGQMAERSITFVWRPYGGSLVLKQRRRYRTTLRNHLSSPDKPCAFVGRIRVFSHNDRFAFFQFLGVLYSLLTCPLIVPLIRPLTPPQPAYTLSNSWRLPMKSSVDKASRHHPHRPTGSRPGRRLPRCPRPGRQLSQGPGPRPAQVHPLVHPGQRRALHRATCDHS